MEPDMDAPPIEPRPLPPDAASVLAAVEAKRGYLLPYHRMFAASAPELLRSYDAFYESLTLVPRILSPAERETVWAGLLAAAREVHGFIHMKRAVKAGLTQADIVRAVAIAAVTDGFATMQFSGDNWAAWTLPDDLEQMYLATFDSVCRELDRKLAHLTALVCHAARRHQAGMTLHLRHAFAAGATPGEICEALSYLLLPCGGNTLIEAVSFWEQAAKAGLVPGPY
jgi:alkylhydroperoxidase/carboxymuconolactone decarboxylase family protein YurZ